MKVPLFTRRMIFYTSHGGYFVFHTENHGISRRFLDIDYNSDNFSVTIREKKKIRDSPRLSVCKEKESPCEERKSVILRDHPCEKKKTVTVRDSPCEKKKRLSA